MLDQWTSVHNQILGRFANLEANLKLIHGMRQSTAVELQQFTKQKELVQKVDKVLEMLIKMRTDTSLKQIETLVNQGLSSIFEKDYQFQIEPVTKRNAMSYQFWIIEDGQKMKIMDSRGGGVIAVISLLLRIVVILLLQLQPILILDESLAQLSREYVDNAAEFFKALGKKLNFTIIMVTHSPEFLEHADKAYRISKPGPDSLIEAVK